MVLIQGAHELEHVAQVIQRYVLAIPNGNGLLGNLVDIEPLHFAYNTGFLALLVASYVALDLHRVRGRLQQPRSVVILLTLAVLLQSWHEVEHIAKLGQFLALGVNGTGGVFGQGPGGILPMFPIPLLHLVYNSIALAPIVGAVYLLIRRMWRGEVSTRFADSTS